MKNLSILMTIFILTGEWGIAYDAHHPDPMAFLNGNHHSRPRDKENPRETLPRIQKWRMFQMHQEEKYVIQPEPYSLASQKQDPELLGPQRTLEKTSGDTDQNRSEEIAPSPVITMTRTDCIAIIGEEKFNKYVTKYGGEKGALQRCRILKRLQKI